MQSRFRSAAICAASLTVASLILPAAHAQDIPTIQTRLLNNTNPTWVSIDYTLPTPLGLLTANSRGVQNLNPAYKPTATQISEALTLRTTGSEAGTYPDIYYVQVGSADPNHSGHVGSPTTDMVSGSTITTLGKMAHFRRLLILALAYNDASGPYHNSATVASDIKLGLSKWISYFPPGNVDSAAFTDDITAYKMSYPNGLGAVCLLVPGLLKADTTLWPKIITYLTQYDNTSNTFGANAPAPFRAAVVGDVLNNNPSALSTVINRFKSRELASLDNTNTATVTSPPDTTDGFDPDSGFAQHTGSGRDMYWLLYGGIFVNNFLDLQPLLTGTTYSMDDRINFVDDAVLNGFQYCFFQNHQDLSADGRIYTAYSGYGAGGSANYLAAITMDTTRSLALQTAATNMQGKTRLVGDKMFWRFDYLTHHRAEWGASVRMSSSRVVGPESDRSSYGFNNHYAGSGIVYLWANGDEFAGNVSGKPGGTSVNWNWRQLPGSTAEQYPPSVALPTHPWGENGLGGTDYAGGVSDGTYSATGYYHSKADVSGSGVVEGHKAVFFFDDEYVLMGASINEVSAGVHPVFTTLNQTRLKDTDTAAGAVAPVSYAVNGVRTDVSLLSGIRPGSFTVPASPTSAAWLLHGDVGYVFPFAGATVNWETRFTSGAAAPGTEDLFWIGIDHGVSPTNGSYWCIVRPHSSVADLSDYAAHRPISYVADSATAQAVLHGPLALLQAIFYQAGTVTSTSWPRSVQVNQPVALMLQHVNAVAGGAGEHLQLTVASPQCDSVSIPSVVVTIKTTYPLSGATNNGDGTYSKAVTVTLPYGTGGGHQGESITLSLPIGP